MSGLDDLGGTLLKADEMSRLFVPYSHNINIPSRSFGTIHWIPKPYVPTAFIHEREAEVRRLDAGLPAAAISKRVHRNLLRFGLIRNSWGSTNLDAGPIALERVDQIYEAFEKGALGPARILPSELEVVNYFKIIQRLPRADLNLDLQGIRSLHRDYFSGVPLQNESIPGRFKEKDNVVVGPYQTLRTTPVDEVEDTLGGLVDWYSQLPEDYPALAAVAIFFVSFQQIHPFGDGNGRLGRLLSLTQLYAAGFDSIAYAPIDDSINQEREEYYSALSRADAGDLDNWVLFYVAQVRKGYRRTLRLADRLQEIPSSYPEGSQGLLEWCFIHRIARFRRREVIRFYPDDSIRTVVRRLKAMEAAGFILGEGAGAGRDYRVLFPAERRAQVSTSTG